MATLTYATVANVKTYLAEPLPSELTDAIIENRINRVSGRVMGSLSDYYATFSDAPATPLAVTEVVEYGAAYECLLFMGQISRSQPSEQYKDRYEYLLGMLMPQVDDNGKKVGPPLTKLTGYSAISPVQVGKINTGDNDPSLLWNQNED